jgi:hypothetical protein
LRLEHNEGERGSHGRHGWKSYEGEPPATDRMRSQSPWLKRLTKPPSSGAGWETYAIIYVPFLMITLVLASHLLVRPQPNAVAESGLLRNEPTEV